MEGLGLLPTRILSGSSSHGKQLLTLDSSVNKPTNGLLGSNHTAKLRHKLLDILHTVGVLTTTVESDSDLTIVHIGDAFDSGRRELEHDMGGG
jgi:hypothetical protein